MEYAALVSLLHITDEILDFDDSDLRFFPFTKKKIESFRETIYSLLAFLDKCPHICSQTVVDFIAKIRDASCEAEDILESLVATYFLQKDGSDSYARLKIGFPEKGFERIAEKLKSIDAEGRIIQIDGGISAPDNDMERELMDQLVGGWSGLDVITIVGMGGIGKTTLARTLYDSQLIKESFNVRCWVTVSQTYVVREIVATVLKSLGYLSREDAEENLFRTLMNNKFLFVLDDVWDVQAWNDIKMLFPDNRNGSRILLTTRNPHVAHSIRSRRIYMMQFLTSDSGWRLFCQVIFGKKNCPPELVQIGKVIAGLCKGHPLAISAICGLLKKEKQTKEYWKNVSESITSVLKTAPIEDWCFGILTLCYNYLPHHLKALFLYFGSFPEDRPVNVFTIVNMWIAEGFIEASSSKGMEEVAKVYLVDLIDRNLVSVDGWDSLGNVKRCKIHDRFRDLCISEARNEKFFSILNNGKPSLNEIYGQRRLIFNQYIEKYVESGCSIMISRDNFPATRSFICHVDRTFFPSTVKLPPGLLKVLKTSVTFKKFPVEILEFVNLKYLQLGYVKEIPSSISRLRNLQTLIAECVGAKQDLPSEIWEMLQLRHIVTLGFYLPFILDVQRKGIHTYGLQNLSTLIEMRCSSCTQWVLERIPNVKELYIFYTMPFHYSTNIVSLCKLESLHCVFEFEDEPDCNILLNNFFPVSLKKLVLQGCRTPWESLSIIGTLPYLEVLKLKCEAMLGKFWVTNDGVFMQLRMLSIEESGLVEWNTEKDHFPKLERLKLKFCYALDTIPYDIGELPTLKIIELTKCSPSAESSAKIMLEKHSEVKISIVS